MKHPGRQALVLSGGGANGAYGVGVLQALSRGRSPSTDFEPIEIAVYSGTSVGAYNTTFLASRADDGTRAAADRLARVWMCRIAARPGSCGNGIYRLRLGPLDLLAPGCLARWPLETVAAAVDDTVFLTHVALARTIRSALLPVPPPVRLAEWIDLSAMFSTDPMCSLIRDTIDRDRLRRSPKPVFVATTNWTRGDLRIYDRDALLEPRGLEILLASAAVPGVFPTVTSRHEVFVDGGVLMNTPTPPALAAGAETIHAVYAYPRTTQIPFNPMPSTVSTIFRLLGIRLNDLMSVGMAKLIGAHATSRVASGHHPERVVIHKYYPPNMFDYIGMLNFSLRRITRLMEQGFHDAIHHDCEVNECVTFPPDGTGAPEGEEAEG